MVDGRFIDICTEHVGRDWRCLGRKLKFSDGQLDIISADYQANGLKEQIYQLLVQWKQRESQKATLPVLVKALHESRCKDTIRKIKTACKGAS